MKLLWIAVALLGVTGHAAAQTGRLEALQSGVTLRMSAPVEPDGGRKIILHMQTNDVYECAGTFIENEVLLEGHKLFIKVKGVRVPEPCSPALGPATTRIDLSKLGLGRFAVRATINRQVFKADLIITENYYDFVIVEKEDPTLFRIHNGRLNLIPNNGIWGVVQYNTPEQRAEVQRFMSALEAAGATRTQLPAGNYDDFYLHQAGTTQEKVVSPTQYEYPYVYQYSGDPAALRGVLESFRGRVQATLNTSDGYVYKNF